MGKDASLTSLLWLFRGFTRMYHRFSRAELDRNGLAQVSHPHILFMLHHMGGTATQRELADMLGVSPPTVAVSIKRMVKAGILAKSQDTQDLRKNTITLTGKGQSLITLCKQTYDQIDQDVFEGFSDHERAVLAGYYRRMLENVERKGGVMPTVLKKGGTDHS